MKRILKFIIGFIVSCFIIGMLFPLKTLLKEDNYKYQLEDSINILNYKIDSIECVHYEEKMKINHFWNVISYIESKNGLYLIGDNGKAKGPLQIHKGVVTDVNKFYHTNYMHNDMFDPTKSRLVGSMYLNINSRRYLNNYNKYPSPQILARMWNGGYNYKNKSTSNYLKKFNKKYENNRY